MEQWSGSVLEVWVMKSIVRHNLSVLEYHMGASNVDQVQKSIISLICVGKCYTLLTF